MKPGLSLRVSQHLALTPQLQQSIRLLQLSTLELNQEIEQMLDDNPFLERSSDEAVREEFGLAQADTPAIDPPWEPNTPEFVANNSDSTRLEAQNNAEDWDATTAVESPSWDGDGSVELQPDDSEWGVEARAKQSSPDEDERTEAAELARSHESLQSFLHRQALALRLGELDACALRFLIESLNDDGYLEDSLEQLAAGLTPSDAEQAQELLHHFTVALGLLHNLEPVGVGARDLGECLRLQLQARIASLDDTQPQERALLQLALRVCAQPLELLARRDCKTLAQRCAGSEASVRQVLALITHLEPKPGRRFVDVARNAIVPDVLVLPAPNGPGGSAQFRVQINPEVLPRLRVHEVYAQVLRNHGKDSNHAGLQQRLQEARWFIKNIQQRFDTILRVSGAIVERQRSFFVHGDLAMRPLVLREIADALGLHESTISRVTSAKYMATPQGTFELKYFFGSGLGTESGGSASSTAVRALIQQFIAAEDRGKPLSDSQLSALLKEQGIDCARRTVAKYREGLRIPITALRKTL